MCGRAPNLNAMPDPISDVGPPSRPRTMGVKDLKETYNKPLPPLRGPTLIIGSRCGCCYVPIPYVDGVTPSWSVSIPRLTRCHPQYGGGLWRARWLKSPGFALRPHSLQRSCIFEWGETAGAAPLRGHHILIVNIKANISKQL